MGSDINKFNTLVERFEKEMELLKKEEFEMNYVNPNLRSYKKKKNKTNTRAPFTDLTNSVADMKEKMGKQFNEIDEEMYNFVNETHWTPFEPHLVLKDKIEELVHKNKSLADALKRLKSKNRSTSDDIAINEAAEEIKPLKEHVKATEEIKPLKEQVKAATTEESAGLEHENKLLNDLVTAKENEAKEITDHNKELELWNNNLLEQVEDLIHRKAKLHQIITFSEQSAKQQAYELYFTEDYHKYM